MHAARFKHFKGNEYIVLCYAKHSETNEELVIYKQDSKEEIWARPKSMFYENVNIDGKHVPRFAAVSD